MNLCRVHTRREPRLRRCHCDSPREWWAGQPDGPDDGKVRECDGAELQPGGIWRYGGASQCLGRRFLHVPDIGAGHLQQCLEGAERRTQVWGRHPRLEFGHRAESGEHVVALERGCHIGWDRERAQATPVAAGQVQLALELHVAAGRLLWVALPDPVVHVVVELVQRDESVFVAVGLAAGEALHQGRGEHRRLLLVLIGEAVPLEGVLHRARCRDHRPATTAAQLPGREASSTLAEPAARTDTPSPKAPP